MTGELSNARSSTEYCYEKREINQIVKNTRAVSRQAASRGHPE